MSRQVDDLKAYDIWLFGQATLLGFDPQRWDNAADLFRQVVQLMPDFAPAFFQSCPVEQLISHRQAGHASRRQSHDAGARIRTRSRPAATPSIHAASSASGGRTRWPNTMSRQ